MTRVGTRSFLFVQSLSQSLSQSQSQSFYPEGEKTWAREKLPRPGQCAVQARHGKRCRQRRGKGRCPIGDLDQPSDIPRSSFFFCSPLVLMRLKDRVAGKQAGRQCDSNAIVDWAGIPFCWLIGTLLSSVLGRPGCAFIVFFCGCVQRRVFDESDADDEGHTVLSKSRWSSGYSGLSAVRWFLPMTKYSAQQTPSA